MNGWDHDQILMSTIQIGSCYNSHGQDLTVGTALFVVL